MSLDPGVRGALLSFYGIAFAWAAAFGLLPLLGPALLPGVPLQGWFTLAGIPTMFGPVVAAAIVAWRRGIRFREAVGLHFRPNRWWLVAWLAPVLFLTAVVLVGALLPGVDLATPLESIQGWGATMPPEARAEAEAQLAAVPPALVALGVVVGGLVAGATVNGVAAFGEEGGWRGFVPWLLSDAPFWPVALGTGALWGLWHAPLVLQGYNFPDAPVAGLAVMTLACALLTPPLLWLRGKAGSVLAAALFHGALNGVAGMAFLFQVGGAPLWVSPLGVAGCLVLLPVNLLLAMKVPMGTLVRDVMADPK